MKRVVVLAAITAVMVLPTAVRADNIAIGDEVDITDHTGLTNGSSSSGTPAPGSLSGTGGAWWLDVGRDAASNSGDFLTFCLELSETIALGSTYYVQSIEPYAVRGGAGGSGGQDDLSLETQVAYHRFRQSFPGAGTSATAANPALPVGWTAALVQEAIWFFEGELVSLNSPNAVVTWVNSNKVGYNFSGYEVVAVNLADSMSSTATNRQSMLALRVAVPDGGATLALLGCALLGLGALRRKLN